MKNNPFGIKLNWWQRFYINYLWKVFEGKKRTGYSDYIIGRRLTNKESLCLSIQDTNFNKEEFEEVLKPFIIRKDKEKDE